MASSTIRIVVVDDKPELRQLVGTILHRHPRWELVGEADDGMAAIELVKALEPDIVIMDIEMPRLDGIEATKRISSVAPRTVVIAFSSYTDTATQAAMMEAGSAAFVPKQEVLQLPSVIEQILHPSYPTQ